MSTTVGKITYFSSKVLGQGSSAKVYEGTFSGREVAVKQIPKSFIKPCLREIDLLIKLDVHKNIIRYFVDEVSIYFQFKTLQKQINFDFFFIFRPTQNSFTLLWRNVISL